MKPMRKFFGRYMASTEWDAQSLAFCNLENKSKIEINRDIDMP